MSHRWQQIEQIYHATLEREESQRAAYLLEVCAGDDSLRREVESLLAQETRGNSFLESPAAEIAARAMAMDPGKSFAGRQLGVYKIVSLLGAGGMGEVYQAHDTRLGRDVAIKVLPTAFMHDAERLARFQREARMLATLNHPNIATIYGLEQSDGIHFLVMELVPGETLAQKLTAGAFPEREAAVVGAQIAEALEEAHEHKLVHRDLKPANVMMTPKGRVKVLDFGVAKLLRSSEETVSELTAAETQGVVGTLPYMAPEQLLGEKVDARTDLWALGAVLYEMVTGRRPFPEALNATLIDSILHQSPAAPREVNARVTQEMESILTRSLEKDRRVRYQSASEILVDLDRVQRGLSPEHAAPTVPGKAHWLRRPFTIAITVGGVMFTALAASLLWLRYLKPAKRGPAAPTEYIQLTNFNDSALAPALSSDGRMLTFVRHGPFAASAPRGQIYVKIFPKGEPVQLTRDDSQKAQPAFSLDGSRIVYTEITNGFKWDTWQVPVLGGAPQPFLANASGLVWTDEGHLLYSEIKEGVHMGLAASTETQTGKRQIYLPPGDGSMAHRSYLSPDHKSLLVVEMDGTGWLPCRLMPFDGSSTGRRVGPSEGQCTTAAWSPDGHWMYFSSSAGGGFHIWRERFPDGVPEQITFGPTEQEGTAVTSDGKYLITSMGLQQASISLHDSNGDRPLTSEGFAMHPTTALSGDRVFYLMQSSASRAYLSGELWSLNLSTGEKERIFPGYLMACYSVSRDGSMVVFTSVGSEAGDGIWIAQLDRRSPPRQLTHGGEYRAFFGAPGEIIYMSQGEVRHLYRMKEDGSGKEMISPDPVTYLINASPDGNWAEVTLPQTPNSDGLRVQFISTHGGKPYLACDACSIGFGPARQESPMFSWSMDGKFVFVALKYYGLHTLRTVVLPYRSDRPLESLWPRGLKSEKDVAGNPGARLINEADAFPRSGSPTYFVWRRSTQSNLYRIPVPD
jgi:eukaryotic-like serine/threonine-protein kinase